MANIKELIQSIESGDSSFDEKLAAINKMEETLVAMKEHEQEAIDDNVELIIEALRTIEAKVEAKLRIIPEKGEQGIQGPKGEQGDRGLDGAQGKDGKSGVDGKDGLDGKDGVSVQDAKIDFDGSLVITLSDGREINVGEVVSVDVAEKIRTVHNIQSGSGGDSQTVLDAIAAIQATIATYGTMATQNANNVAITGGNINNTVIGGTTPVAGTFTTLGVTTSINASSGSANADLNVNSKGTGNVNIGTGNGTQFRVGDTFAGGTATNFYKAQGTAGGGVVLVADGASTNVQAYLASKGASPISFTTAGVGVEQMRVSHTASAVNYVQVTGAATTNRPAVSTQGSDNNISLNVTSKGASSVYFNNGSGTGFEVTASGTAVNFLTATGVATNISPSIKANGNDTNISQVFQSKGTGAIDLAAGSSGVNISNGGTVTAITRTAAGSAYSLPITITVSAPTTAGGVQAQVSLTSFGSSTASVVSGGTGYTNGDVLTIVGGTPSGAATYTVTGVSGGAVTSVSALNSGAYTTAPTNPVSVTGGTGSGATLNLTYYVPNTFSITNAGSGYVEQPTVTFSGGGGSGAAAYATVGASSTLKSIHTQLSLQTAGGEVSRFSSSQGGVATGRVDFAVDQFSRGIITGVNSLVLTSVGAGNVAIQTNSTAQQQFVVTHTASAVNYVQVTGDTTGNTGGKGPSISSQGSDADVNLRFNTKGAGSHTFATNSTQIQFRVVHTGGTIVNYTTATGNITGAAPTFSVAGSDTNIDLALTPKGTGALVAQASDGTTINVRGANAVDWQTSRGNAANVASSTYATLTGGTSNTVAGFGGALVGGNSNQSSGSYSFTGGGRYNISSASFASVAGGENNLATGQHNFIGGGFKNSGTANAAVTTQSATMNGTTAVTLSGSNASIKVGQQIIGTSIQGDPPTYVAAISGTSLTLSQNASGSSTSTLSFYTPHGVVVGGGNNQATGAYSFIGGGGDAGTAANRNVASGDWSFVGGGAKNTASGTGSVVVGGGSYGSGFSANASSGVSSFVGAGYGNIASGFTASVVGGTSNTANNNFSVIVGGANGTTRALVGNFVHAGANPLNSNQGASQTGLLILGRQTTDATATVLTADTSAAGTTNQVLLPNNSAYYFKGSVIANVTGGGNTKGWTIEGAIKRGANAASTALVGTPTVTSSYADAGASTWAITATADTTNGGLAITFTGQAGTTIRVVCKIETTEVTF